MTMLPVQKVFHANTLLDTAVALLSDAVQSGAFIHRDSYTGLTMPEQIKKLRAFADQIEQQHQVLSKDERGTVIPMQAAE